MKWLLLFLCGYLFDKIGNPVLDNFVELFGQFIEAQKGKYILQIDKVNKEINKETEEYNTNVIGFNTEPYYEDYEDEE